jgi:hypothetical protein
LTVPQLREFLRHTNVSVKGVIDLEDDSPVDGYEVPARMREQLFLRMPAGVFPWSANLSRNKDLDHTIAYVPPHSGGPPGQTRIGNLGPLGRSAHRVKTHAPGWRHRQPVPGVFLWRTPHGYWLRVDATGTHLLGKDPSEDDLAGRTRTPLRAPALVPRPASRAENRLRAKITHVRELTAHPGLQQEPTSACESVLAGLLRT